MIQSEAMVDLPPSIPDFTLLRRIGRGSYGEVWLARSVTGVYRAVKIVYRSRFDEDRPYEREFAGIRQFEPISVGQGTQVSVLHVGRNEAAGFFYYVMELADDAETGEEIVPETYVPKTLKEMRARQNRLPIADCISIGVALTRALAHLHSHGLVHRDIKPSNVIFVHGIPKLADIGLVSAADTCASFVGTEGFVPPEGPGSMQADLFSLGKVLYEISTGRDRNDFPKLPEDIETEPDARALLELNEVTLRACDADLGRRYASAEAMQDDLVLLQAGKSVKRLHLIERRFKVVAKYGIAATAVTIVAVTAFLWASHQAREAKRHRVMAEEALHASQLNQIRAQRMTDLAGRRFNTLELLKKSAASKANRLELRNEAIACFALQDVRPSKQWSKTPQSESWHFDPELRRYFTNDARGNITVHDTETDRELALLPSQGERLAQMFWNVDGRLIASLDQKGGGRIWDVARQVAVPLKGPSGSRLVRFTDKHLVILDASHSLHFIEPASGSIERSLDGPFRYPRISPNGETIAEIDGRQVILRSAVDGAALVRLDHPQAAGTIVWHPDGRRAATVSANSIYFWDCSTGRQITVANGHDGTVLDVAFSADGGLLFSSSWDGTTRIWHIDTYREVVRTLTSGNALRVSPDARRLAFHSWDHSSVEMWDVANGEEVRRFQVPGTVRQSFRSGFSPDSKWLYLVNIDGTYIFEVATGRIAATLPFPQISDAAFHPQRNSFITCGNQGLDQWPIISEQPFHLGQPEPLALGNVPGANAFSLAPDGQRLATIADDGFRILKLNSPHVVVRSYSGTRPLSTPVLSPDGRWVAMGKRGRRLQICDAHTGKAITNIALTGDCTAYFSPDNRWLLSATAKEFRYWHAGSWTPALRIPRYSEVGRRPAAFSPNGKILAVAIGEQAVRLMVAGTDRELATIPTARLITGLDFTRDSSQLLITYEPGYVQLWDLPRIRAQLAAMNLDWD